MNVQCIELANKIVNLEKNDYLGLAFFSSVGLGVCSLLDQLVSADKVELYIYFLSMYLLAFIVSLIIYIHLIDYVTYRKIKSMLCAHKPPISAAQKLLGAVDLLDITEPSSKALGEYVRGRGG